MTTQEIANKWADYCREGKWDEAQAELYADHCVSLEMEGAPGPQRVEGREGLKVKGEKWAEMVETMHGLEIEGPLVAGDFFTAVMRLDVTMKGRPRTNDPEIALFKVEDGKIVLEQFFYGMG